MKHLRRQRFIQVVGFGQWDIRVDLGPVHIEDRVCILQC